jgi:hypothetical protein
MPNFDNTFKKFLSCIIGSLIIVSVSLAQIQQYYYYHPENDFGSDLFFNPSTLIMNGSFDILRNGGHTKNIFDQHYQDGIENVFRNISDPLTHIKKFGWNNFLTKEVFPVTADFDDAHYFPNYVTHIIGNGMLYVKTAEWYDYHEYPKPFLLSFFTTTFYQFLNESVENGRFKGTNVDPIADLLIFNPLGFLVFSSEYVKEFFSSTVPLYDWSLQPLYNPFNNNLENAGQQYFLHIKNPWGNKLSGFFYWGICGIMGLTMHSENGHNYSLGVGRIVNKLKEKRLNGSRFLTPDMDGALSFFYDKNHSLLLSVIISGPRMYNCRINIYPGFIDMDWFKPGFYIAYGEWDNFLFGISFANFPFGIVTDAN